MRNSHPCPCAGHFSQALSEHRAKSSRGRRRYARRLVAAGVVLVRNQDQARAGGSGLGAGRLTEGAQDAENCDIGGENAEADGGDDGEAEDDRHQKRNHGLKILLNLSNEAGHSESFAVQSESFKSSVFNLTCVDAPR